MILAYRALFVNGSFFSIPSQYLKDVGYVHKLKGPLSQENGPCLIRRVFDASTNVGQEAASERDCALAGVFSCHLQAG